jgi:AraC-like DNA-binding protein
MRSLFVSSSFLLAMATLAAPTTTTAFPGEAQQALAATLPEGGSVVQVAHALNCSVRTLQRKLVASGTTFRELTDSVRSQLAESYLSDPKVSSSEVATLLGFSEQRAFNRAFSRWTGESPGRWRTQSRRSMF